MNVVARAEALAATASPDGAREWDPSWHVGPIEERTPAERREAEDWLRRRSDELDWLYDRLEDDASRATLVRLLAHRLAGSRHVALGVGRETSERLTRFASTALACEVPPEAELAAKYTCYDLEPLGLGLRVVAVPMFAIHTFLLEQYRHPHIAEANVRPGDLVVDGGAFWGETALWLADRSSPGGRVVAFEPDHANESLIEANLRLNPEHGRSVQVRFEALWESDTRLQLAPRGAATSVMPGSGASGVPAVSLDELRRKGALDAVDFIKLDVEGAELAALRGAADLIRERAPRLAVAVYHHPDDIFAIPRLLDEMMSDYSLAITHRSLHQFDTVLFAWASAR